MKKIRWHFIAEGIIAVTGAAVLLYVIYKATGKDFVGFTDGHD